MEALLLVTSICIAAAAMVIMYFCILINMHTARIRKSLNEEIQRIKYKHGDRQ